MLALTWAGSVGTRPDRGGVTGLAAGSLLAGYVQFAPKSAGGRNGGSTPPGGRSVVDDGTTDDDEEDVVEDDDADEAVELDVPASDGRNTNTMTTATAVTVNT
jgi:hypothetical protein